METEIRMLAAGSWSGLTAGSRARLIEPRRVRWDRHGNPTLGLCAPAPPRPGAADSLSGERRVLLNHDKPADALWTVIQVSRRAAVGHLDTPLPE
jgi:hypothetical protein